MALIDTPEFQRLRRIKQLALTSYIYPGALHARFEHSLGVLDVATRMFEAIKRNTLDINPELWKRIEDGFGDLKINSFQALGVLRIAALLHDIGHLPFSHASEAVLPPNIKHEHVSVEVARKLENKIDEWFFPGATNYAIKLINPEATESDWELRILRKILSGQIDADRSDYLIRDSIHCGVKYGVFDLERLISSLMIGENLDIAIEYGGIHAVEALILARYYMFTQVYLHRTRRLYDHYLNEFNKLAIGKLHEKDLIQVLCWDDEKIINKAREALSNGKNKELKKAAKRIWARSVYTKKHKTVYESNLFAGGLRLGEDLNKKTEELRDEFSDCDFILDQNCEGKIHKFYQKGSRTEGEEELKVYRRTSDEMTHITDESWVIKNIPKEFWIFRVFCSGEGENFEKVKRVFSEFKKEG